MKFGSEAEAEKALGLSVPPHNEFDTYRANNISTQPATSFSTTPWAASSFSGTQSWQIGTERLNPVRVGIVTVVPAERILSTPLTGVGCLPEAEVVVLGGSDDSGLLLITNGNVGDISPHGDGRGFSADALDDMIQAEIGEWR
jgi:hypothetical protein